jgi:hypothetical protein
MHISTRAWRASRAVFLLAAAITTLSLEACGGDDGPAGPNGNQPDPCTTDPSLPTCPGPRGSFAFLPEATLSMSFTPATERRLAQGDFNGDGRMDLLFDELLDAPALNRVHVAFGQTDGSFLVATPFDNGQPAPAEGWTAYQLLVGDLNADGDDDLIWNHRGNDNVVYVGLSSGSGAFAEGPRQTHTNNGWTPYTATVGDMNGDGKADVVWNARSAASTRTYVGFATANDGTLTMVDNVIERSGNYSEYEPAHLARFNADAFDDIQLSAISSTRNDTYIGRFTPVGATEGSLTWSVHQRGAGWGGYEVLAGDIDGHDGADLFWFQPSPTATAISTAVNDGTGVFTDLSQKQSIPIGLGANGIYFFPVLADFDKDGRADALANHVGATSNELIVAFGKGDGTFELAGGVQQNTRTASPAWTAFANRLVGDVNGDGRADVIWATGQEPVRLFVALARHT